MAETPQCPEQNGLFSQEDSPTLELLTTLRNLFPIRPDFPHVWPTATMPSRTLEDVMARYK